MEQQGATFREIAKEWLKFREPYLKEGTYSIYTLQLYKHINPKFGDCTINPSESEVQAFVMECLTYKALSFKTTKDLIILLKMILRWSYKYHNWKYPEYEIHYPTSCLESRRIEVLPKNAQKIIFDHIEKNFTFRNLGIYLCLTTGMRIGELCALKWEDIDIDEGVINISRTIQRIYMADLDGNRRSVVVESTPKTKNSRRQIPITREVKRLIKPLFKALTPEFYVLTNDRKPTEPQTYRMYYRELLKQLDLPRIKFHGLRHTFATRCVASGADIKTVSALLGHADISTTLNTYVHPSMDDKRNVINKVFKFK